MAGATSASKRFDAPDGGRRACLRHTQPFRRPLHNGVRSGRKQHSHSGSINEVGCRFQSFKINDLEMVGPDRCRLDRPMIWLRRVEPYVAA